MYPDRLASTFNRTLTPATPTPLSPPAYQSPPSQSPQDANARDRTRRRMGRAGEFDWSHLSVGARAGALPPKVRAVMSMLRWHPLSGHSPP